MILTADRFIYNILTADATLTTAVGARIYSEVAPEGTASPWIVYQCQTPESRSIVGLGGVVIMIDEVYTVRAICQGNNYSTIETIANRIITLLHHKHGAVTSGYALACELMGTVKYPTVEDGIPYRHLGAMFRINSQ